METENTSKPVDSIQEKLDVQPGRATKKFRIKVYYDPQEGKCQGWPMIYVQTVDGKQVATNIGTALIFSPEDQPLPAKKQREDDPFVEAEAELTVFIPQPKAEGEITVRKTEGQ